MRPFVLSRQLRLALTLCVCVLLLGSVRCSTTPHKADQPAFISESKAARQWFEDRTPGLRQQINNSAGYVVFPNVGQWGIIFTGGKFGRGMVCDNHDMQIGWGAINTGSLGLQAGVQGFKMLVVFQDAATLDAFKKNQLSGSANAVAVVAEKGGSLPVNFDHGVALYQGANAGLMAGVNVALDYMRYKPLDQAD